MSAPKTERNKMFVNLAKKGYSPSKISLIYMRQLMIEKQPVENAVSPSTVRDIVKREMNK